MVYKLKRGLKLNYFKLLIFLLLFALSITNVYAEQTIFNVPSADVTEKGHVFLQEEAQFRGWNPDANLINTVYTATGVGHNTEACATLYNVGAPDTGLITLGVGFKSAIPIPYLKEQFPKQEFKIIVGSEVLIGLEGNDVGNWTYVELSGKIPKINTRLTAGVDYGTRQLFGVNRSAFLAGIEQPVTKNLTLQADWFSGAEHFAGFLIAGFNYKLPKSTTLYAGYQIPNTPQNGISGFCIELAKIF